MLGGVNNGLFLRSFAGFAVVLVFSFILKWAFSKGHSVVAAPSRRGNSDQYGLLKVVASPLNFIEGEMMRQKLLEAGIKANLTQTLEGPRIFVFERDLNIARAILNS
jgi:hypothetical protein